MLVPYLVGQLSQPVRLQQQRGRRAETKPKMRYVGVVMVKTRKEEEKEGGRTKQRSKWKLRENRNRLVEPLALLETLWLVPSASGMSHAGCARPVQPSYRARRSRPLMKLMPCDPKP